MGATTFAVRSKGKTAQEAFGAAIQEATWESGHAGYTGTIAEKSSFVMIAVPAGRKPGEYADSLIDDGDARIDDKWGPAGCVQLAAGEWLFFGWASE